MSDMATRNQERTPVQQLITGLRSDQFRAQLEAALPPTVTPERFVRVAVTALQQQPSIAEANPDSILQAFMRCAQDGLMPDGREAAIVKRGQNASYMPMIGGFRKIAADHGWTLRTRVAYAKDDFSYSEEPPAIHHVPVRPGEDRGELIAAYAIATHVDGRRIQRVLHPEEVAKRRASATTENVWKQWTAQMWEKSAGRDLFAEIPIGDLDERVKSVLEATRIEPDAARATLYGPPSTRGELPPAAEDDQGLQAEASMGDASAPGPDDDEPDLDTEPEAEASSFTGPADASEDPSVIAAKHAAMFEIPNGKHKGVTLGEVLDKTGGETWLGWALTHIENPPPYKQAIHDFARVYSPEQYQQALGQQELQA